MNDDVKSRLNELVSPDRYPHDIGIWSTTDALILIALELHEIRETLNGIKAENEGGANENH